MRATKKALAPRPPVATPPTAREVISLTLTADEKEWIDSRGEPRGRYFSRLIARDRAATPSPDIAAATLALRARLDTIDDAIAEAQDLASEIETAAGLVTATGARADEATE